MPRYYFDIQNGSPYRDEVGEDLLDDQAAWLAAMRLAREIEDVLRPSGTWNLEVRTKKKSQSSVSRSERNGSVTGRACAVPRSRVVPTSPDQRGPWSTFTSSRSSTPREKRLSPPSVVSVSILELTIVVIIVFVTIIFVITTVIVMALTARIGNGRRSQTGRQQESHRWRCHCCELAARAKKCTSIGLSRCDARRSPCCHENFPAR